MKLKKPTTFDEQIERLKEHGMAIDDTLEAKNFLMQVSYYRFTGYCLQFRKNENDSSFSNKISFGDICQIYWFDESMRKILRVYIEKLEIYFRTQIAHGFAALKCTNPPHDQHYDKDNFFRKTGYQEVLESIGRDLVYHGDSSMVKYHRDNYIAILTYE